MVIGAHAFDAEVIGGPLLATTTTRGGSGTLVHLTWGEQGHPSLSPERYLAQKVLESEAAAKQLRATRIGLNVPDTKLSADRNTVEKLASVIRSYTPDLIVTHWRGSWHRDHAAAYQVTLDACLLAGLPTWCSETVAWSPADIMFGENWEDSDNYKPDTILDVSAGYEAWVLGIHEYGLACNDISGFRFFDYYHSLYVMRGCLIRAEYGQAFMHADQSITQGLTQMNSDTGSLRVG